MSGSSILAKHCRMQPAPWQTTTRAPLHRLHRARIGAGNDGERIALIGLRAEHVHEVN